MKILIIGCGYVGSVLAPTLQKLGHHVTTTTRSVSKIPFLESISNRAVVFQSNDFDALKTLLMDQDAVIVTLAADSPQSYENTYLEMAKNLVKAISSANKLSKVIYTSSTSVYGDHEGEIVDEETEPATNFSTGKILIETEKTFMSVLNDKCSVCLFRLGEIYGPDRMISDRLKHMHGKPLPGNGSSLTNLIHVEDIINAIIFALENPLQGIYNLCNDTHLTRKDFYEKICRKMGMNLPEWNVSKVLMHSGNKCVSNIKIKSQGFQFSHNYFDD